MKLEKIKAGLYSLDGEPVLNNNLLIAVHPYFLEHNRPLDKKYKTKSIKKKIERINNFIIKYSGPKIILEEAINVEKTIKKYESIPELKNTFFIRTKEGDPDPLENEISYETMLDYFQIMSKNKKIILVGGFDWGDYGCLGDVKKNLIKRGLECKVIKNLTFS